jgi:hypothetical protein
MRLAVMEAMGAAAAKGVLAAVEAGSRLTKKLSDVEAGAAAGLKGQVPVAERPTGAVAKCVLTALAGSAGTRRVEYNMAEFIRPATFKTGAEAEVVAVG